MSNRPPANAIEAVRAVLTAAKRECGKLDGDAYDAGYGYAVGRLAERIEAAIGSAEAKPISGYHRGLFELAAKASRLDTGVAGEYRGAIIEAIEAIRGVPITDQPDEWIQGWCQGVLSSSNLFPEEPK
jgi:hypothetical protein